MIIWLLRLFYGDNLDKDVYMYQNWIGVQPMTNLKYCCNTYLDSQNFIFYAIINIILWAVFMDIGF